MKQSMAGQETAQPCRRKRTLVETKTDKDLDTDGKHHFTFLFSPSFSPPGIWLSFFLGNCSSLKNVFVRIILFPYRYLAGEENQDTIDIWGEKPLLKSMNRH